MFLNVEKSKLMFKNNFLKAAYYVIVYTLLNKLRVTLNVIFKWMCRNLLKIALIY